MSKQGQRSYIAREGWPAVLVLILTALVLLKLLGPLWSLPAWLGAMMLGFLYRDPSRPVPPLPLAVISPVDAKVVFVKKDHDPYLGREALRIRLQINRLGIFGLRSPIEGKLIQRWLYKGGEGENAPHLDKLSARRYGRHYVMWLQSDEKDDVVLILDIPSSWQKPQCYVHVGERIGQGQRCGRTRFGGHVEIFMPGNVRMEVGHGDHVVAGASVLATIIH
jgi:phosphatidylserine decarboxylase